METGEFVKIKEKFKNADEFNFYMISEIIEKVKKDGSYGIVDFGAGHSVYDDENIFLEIKKEISKFKNIILLLPSVDIEESLNILQKRSTGDYTQNRKFLTSRCNNELATITIYTNNKNPIEIADDILEIIEKRKDKDDIERE